MIEEQEIEDESNNHPRQHHGIENDRCKNTLSKEIAGEQEGKTEGKNELQCDCDHNDGEGPTQCLKKPRLSE